MMVSETTQVADEALPAERFRQHLRLGSGFSTAELQDPLLTSFLRAALAAIEGRTGKVLLSREFEMRADDWSGDVILPVVPVSEVVSLVTYDDSGAETTVDVSGFRLAEERGYVVVKSPRVGVPSGGSAVLRVRAGMAAAFDALPDDLAQAVLLLAAHYYENRHETALGSGCMPFGVTALIERYRTFRVSLGAAQ